MCFGFWIVCVYRNNFFFIKYEVKVVSLTFKEIVLYEVGFDIMIIVYSIDVVEN